MKIKDIRSRETYETVGYQMINGNYNLIIDKQGNKTVFNPEKVFCFRITPDDKDYLPVIELILRAYNLNIF